MTSFAAKRKPIKQASKKPGRTSKMSSVRESHDSQAVHRVLSARRLKVNELRNRVEELNQQFVRGGKGKQTPQKAKCDERPCN